MTTLEDVIVQLQTNSDNTVAATEASTESIVGSFQSNFTTLIDTIRGDSLDKLEATREANRAARQGAPGAGGLLAGAGAGAGGLLGGLGGLLGGLGGIGAGAGGLGAGLGVLLGGAGIGGGALLAGGGIGLAGLAALLLSINNLDGKKVRANVNEILAIKDDVDGVGDVAAVGITLGALGAGLIAFSAGSALASVSSGMAEGVELFTKSNWAETVKQNVLTLLSIGDEFRLGELQVLAESGPLALALGGLGIGLAAFAVGEGLAASSQAISHSVEMFTGQNWAESVKNNVLTLLSIGDSFKGGEVQAAFESGALAVALGALGAGLVAFSVGEGAAAAAGAMSGALELFTEQNWAESVKQNVLTLLSIDDALGGTLNMLGETALFTGAMTAISAGLVAFAVGQGANQMTQTLDLFGENGFAQTIKDNVVTLLSINELADEGQALEFLEAMTSMSAGLALFSGARLFEGLVTAGKNILNFFSGGDKSAIGQVMKLAESSDDIEKASDGLQSMSDALTRFAAIDFNVKDADFTGLTRNIQKAVPLIQSLATGESKLLGKDIPSIFDPSLRLDEMVVEIGKIRAILGASVEISTVAPNQVSIPADQLNATQNRTIQAQAANVFNNVITDASVNTQSTNTIVNGSSQTPNVYNDRMALMLGTASGR